jgi:hypothetical protein
MLVRMSSPYNSQFLTVCTMCSCWYCASSCESFWACVLTTRRYQHPLQQARQRRDPSLRLPEAVLRRRMDLRGHRVPRGVHPALRSRQVIPMSYHRVANVDLSWN